MTLGRRPRYASIYAGTRDSCSAAGSRSASFQPWLALALEREAHYPRPGLLLGSLLLAMIAFNNNDIAG